MIKTCEGTNNAASHGHTVNYVIFDAVNFCGFVELNRFTAG